MDVFNRMIGLDLEGKELKHHNANFVQKLQNSSLQYQDMPQVISLIQHILNPEGKTTFPYSVKKHNAKFMIQRKSIASMGGLFAGLRESEDTTTRPKIFEDELQKIVEKHSKKKHFDLSIFNNRIKKNIASCKKKESPYQSTVQRLHDLTQLIAGLHHFPVAPKRNYSILDTLIRSYHANYNNQFIASYNDLLRIIYDKYLAGKESIERTTEKLSGIPRTVDTIIRPGVQKAVWEKYQSIYHDGLDFDNLEKGKPGTSEKHMLRRREELYEIVYDKKLEFKKKHQDELGAVVNGTPRRENNFEDMYADYLKENGLTDETI